MPKQPTLSKYWKPRELKNRAACRKIIADQTLEALEKCSYDLNGTTHILDLECTTKATKYYAPDSLLSAWQSKLDSTPRTTTTQISLLEISTLAGARLIANGLSDSTEKIGVLNFASAKKPGGGFLTGAQAQEESIARSSTIYPSLMTATGQQFYTLHKKSPRSGYYSHAMIYSPSVCVFRDDDGEWVEPITVDVLTSPAVNAGDVRKKLAEETDADALEESIEREMKERMARTLFLFEQQGAKHLVLGSFGTGVFKNKVEMVGRLWAELLNIPGARFKDTFDSIVFAILGTPTFTEFSQAFDTRSAVPTTDLPS